MENLLHRRLLGTEPAASPGNGGGDKANELYISERNFDSNAVIILVGLLCALICALGLSSIGRCTPRFRGGLETLEEAAAARLAATSGMKKRALRDIPVWAYGSGLDFLVTECSICLGEFLEEEKVRVLPKCNHGFHVKCIDRWLASHSSCPNCRHSLLERGEPHL